MGSTPAADAGAGPIRSLADIEAIERVPLGAHGLAASAYELLRRGAAHDPRAIALHDLPNGRCDEPPASTTYAGLLEEVHRAANAYAGLGIGPRDVVAILLPNVPQNYVALLGAMTAGIAFPINWMLEARQLDALLQAAGATVLVALGPRAGFDIWERVEALAPETRARLRIVRVGTGGPTPPARAGVLEFDAMLRAQPGENVRAARRFDPDDVAILIHTGGTTGRPKIARIPQRAIAYKCWALATLLALRPGLVALGASPLFHVGGIVLRALAPLSSGMTLVIPGPTGLRDKGVVRDYWRLVERYRITELSGVPTSLGALVDVPLAGADISSLRPYAVTGSASLPPDIARRLEAMTGVRVLADYGLTEATATVTLPPRDAPPRVGSSGVRLPYTQIRIATVDPDGRTARDARAGANGEILVRGPGTALGYVDATADAECFVDGDWMRTGDLGRLDDDGWLWLTGRSKDLIIRGGHNIDPRIIEDALQEHPDVALAAAVGRPDAYAGELPVAYVQLREGGRASGESLNAHARGRVAERAAAPVAVTVVDALPLTAVGKVYKPALREHAAAQAIRLGLQALPGVAGVPEVVASVDAVRGVVWRVCILVSCPEGEVEGAVRGVLDRLVGGYSIQWDRGP